MRFKGTLTEHGKQKLEKGFLPTLEKCGKQVQVLLSEEEVNFMQTPLNTDGPSITARFNSDTLFHSEGFKLDSRHGNLVAFNTDLGMLLRALRSASANEAETVDVKLTQKAVSTGGGVQTNKPFLSFSARSSSMTLVQDLPISRPYLGPEIDRLVVEKAVDALCPYYLDIRPCTSDLQAMADRMKSISDVAVMSTCMSGDLYADVSAVNVQLGVQLTSLTVFPQEVHEQAQQPDRTLPVSEQLTAALESGDATSVAVPLKHLSRVLNIVSLSQPAQILCGIAEHKRHMHIMFVYEDQNRQAMYDDSVALSFKIPCVVADDS